MLEVKDSEMLKALVIELRALGVTKFSIGDEGVQVEMTPSFNLDPIEPAEEDDPLLDFGPRETEG